MKVVVDDGMVDLMPSRGQNLVIPVTNLYHPTSRRAMSLMDDNLKPTTTLALDIPRADYTEGKWYSSMALYCKAVEQFHADTSDYRPGCPHCTTTDEPCSTDGSDSSMSAGWAFFWIFFGMLLVPCIGGITYYFLKKGCNSESVMALPYKTKEMCMHYCCGSRWERSYGSLSGDPADGMSRGGCCQSFDWRSYVPGMKGSALQDQYSDLQGGTSLKQDEQEQELEAYAPDGMSFTASSTRVEIGGVEKEED